MHSGEFSSLPWWNWIVFCDQTMGSFGEIRAAIVQFGRFFTASAQTAARFAAGSLVPEAEESTHQRPQIDSYFRVFHLTFFLHISLSSWFPDLNYFYVNVFVIIMIFFSRLIYPGWFSHFKCFTSQYIYIHQSHMIIKRIIWRRIKCKFQISYLCTSNYWQPFLDSIFVKHLCCSENFHAQVLSMIVYFW